MQIYRIKTNLKTLTLFANGQTLTLFAKDVQEVPDILQKLLSSQSEPFDPILLTNALVKVWNKYKNTTKEITKSMMSIVYELSESPEYCQHLMKSGLVELLMKDTIINFLDDNSINLNDDEKLLLQSYEIGIMNILNNLAMINDGKQYLNSIECQQVVIKNGINGIISSNGKVHTQFSDNDQQILLKGLRTIALLNGDNNDYTELIKSNGFIQTLENIIINTDNQLLAKEAFSIIQNISTNAIELNKNNLINPQIMFSFVGNQKLKFQNNTTVSSLCTEILSNLQPILMTNVADIPEVPDIPIEEEKYDNDIVVNSAVVTSSNIPLPAPNTNTIDAKAIFQQALDRRLADDQKEEALVKFLDYDINDNDIQELIENHGIDKLVSALQKSRKGDMTQKLVNALNKVTQKGDDSFEYFVGAGGVGVLVQTVNNNISDKIIINESLHFIGEISVNNHLKTLLGMHNMIQLIIKCIRENDDDIRVLDKCMYVLANLAYDHNQNMTQIIELGGLDDVLKCCKQHIKHKLLMQSCMDLLSNLMHNSNNNRIAICAKLGKIILICLTTYSKDSKVAVSCLRALGNLAFVPENINKLVKYGIIETIVDSMTTNLKDDICLQMGAAVLSNLASDQRVSTKMIEGGVLGIILHISQAFPDLIELQKSCLGCMGNIANNVQNCYIMIDNGCGKRILEILERLDFDESIIKLSLQLIKMLSVTPEVSIQMAKNSACDIIQKIIKNSIKKHHIIRFGCQALCKIISNEESSKIASTQNVVDSLCTVAKDEHNFANAPLMIDIMKVFQNMCQIEMNSQSIARYASVPILRGMETMKENSIFMNVSSTLIGNLAVYSSASKHIVKRGGCAVCIECIKYNMEHQGVLSKLVRCIANLILTETKAYDKFIELEAIQIIQNIQNRYPHNKQIEKSSKAFIRCMKMKSVKINAEIKESKALKDKVDIKYIKYLTSGVMMKKFCSSAKPRKRIVRLTENLEYIVLKDPTGKKAPKSYWIRNIDEIRTGACTFTLRRTGLGWKKAKPERCFALFTKDLSGNAKTLDLECKTIEEYQKWTIALDQVIKLAHEHSDIKYT